MDPQYHIALGVIVVGFVRGLCGWPSVWSESPNLGITWGWVCNCRAGCPSLGLGLPGCVGCNHCSNAFSKLMPDDGRLTFSSEIKAVAPLYRSMVS